MSVAVVVELTTIIRKSKFSTYLNISSVDINKSS